MKMKKIFTTELTESFYKILFCSLSCLFIITLLITVYPASAANWWDKFGEPEYGETIAVMASPMTPFGSNVDPWYHTGVNLYHLEIPFFINWTTDRDVFPFKMDFVPEEYWSGVLAESWEMPDRQTMIVHFRKGIHWQDKPPVNGREFTAYDAEYHFHRILGSGSGFTEPNPFYADRLNAVDTITAKDKYTLVVKFKAPTGIGQYQILVQSGQMDIAPREPIEQGVGNDWHYAVGTGPWILSDHVADSMTTYTRNPAYWGFDERHPKNRLPYADTLKVLKIPDVATALSALRTGKIDLMAGISWQQAASLAEKNPDLVQHRMPAPGISLDMRNDKKPFNDIRVRKALEMAIDRPTIAKNYYGGTVDGKPCGMMNPTAVGWVVPYDKWPKELQDEYAYNPDKAKKLLAEAGYPNGFKTNIVAGSNSDLQLLQAIKSYFMDIGVDMEIRSMDPVTADAYLMERKHDQMSYGIYCGVPWPISVVVARRTSNYPRNYTACNDPGVDEGAKKFNTSIDPKEVQQAFIDVDMRVIKQHFSITTFPTSNFNIHQSYLKGYSGEFFGWGAQWLLARFWVDQGLKQSMGR